MTQSLGQFVKKTMNTFSDQYKANEHTGTPLIVLVHEYKTGLKTKHAPNGDGEGVSVDVLDLTTNLVHCNVLWMGAAVRDQLRDYAGTQQLLPMKLTWTAPQGGGNNYITPEPLEGAELQTAQAFVQSYPTYMADQRFQKLAAWEAEQAATAQQPQAAPAAPAMPTLQGPAPQAAPPAPAPAQQAAPAAPPAPAPVQPQAAPAAPPAPAPVQPQAAPQPPAPAAQPPQPVQQAAPPVAAQPGQMTNQTVDTLLESLG